MVYPKFLSSSIFAILLFIFASGNVQAQTTIWLENFSLPNGTKIDAGATAWTTIAPPGCAICPPDFEVDGNRFKIFGYGTEGIWISQEINIATFTNVQLSVDVSETGDLESPVDYINFSYRLDGGPETPFATNGSNSGNFNTLIASQTGLSGSIIQIIVRGQTDELNERIFFDNVLVQGIPSTLPFDDIVLSLKSNAFESRLLECDMNLSTKVIEINLERSENGVQWETISTLDGPFDNSIFQFEDTDRFHENQLIYYRVQGLDSDGEKGFSNVVSANGFKSTILKVYPNPTEDVLHYVLPENGFEIDIVNTQGRIVFTALNADAIGTLSLAGIESGVYILNASKNGEILNERIIIQ